MPIKNKTADNIVYFLLGSLYVYALCMTVISSTVLEVRAADMFVAGAALLTAFFVIFYNKYTMSVFGIIFAVAALLIAYKFRNMKESGTFYETWVYLKDTYMFIRGYLPYETVYNKAIITTVCIIVALYTVLTLRVTFNFYMLTALGIVLFGVNWVMDFPQSDNIFVIFLFCFCVLLAKEMNMSGTKKEGKTAASNGVFTLMIMPVCLIVVLAANSLPAGFTGFDSQMIADMFKKPVEALEDFLYLAFNPKYFTFQSTGFSGKGGKLGGHVSLNGRGVMEVYADERTYLSGAVKDIYTGNSWINSDGEYLLDDRALDDIEFLESALALGKTDISMALEDLSKADAGIFALPFDTDLYVSQYAYEGGSGSRIRNLSVYIGPARTGTLFRPVRPVSIDTGDDITTLKNDMGDLRSLELLPKYYSYSYRYLSTNYKNEDVLDILRSSERNIYQRTALDIMNAIRIYNRDVQSAAGSNAATVGRFAEYAGIYLNTLVPYADEVYRSYTTLPDTVPERVYELAHELTDSYDNNYDKVKAIEEYLALFPYTLTPGSVPDGWDFVDYFLFEGKEGYCTYYATAMAVLSRCIGLPSRYIEGYIMPAERNDNGSYYVTNRQAHSWSEVYFEGFGWVPFEATAPYNYAFYERTVPAGVSIFSDDFWEEPDNEDYLYGMGVLFEEGRKPKVETVPTEQSPEPVPVKGMTVVLWLGSVVVGLFILVQLFLAVRVIQEKVFLWRIKKKSNNEQAVLYFKGILKMTKYYKYPIEHDETPMRYAVRMGRRFTFDNASLSLIDLARIFYKAKYSGLDIDDRERDSMMNAYFELLDYIRRNRKAFEFVMSRYVLGTL